MRLKATEIPILSKKLRATLSAFVAIVLACVAAVSAWIATVLLPAAIASCWALRLASESAIALASITSVPCSIKALYSLNAFLSLLDNPSSVVKKLEELLNPFSLYDKKSFLNESHFIPNIDNVWDVSFISLSTDLNILSFLLGESIN